jgi:hypothetical protein
LTDAQAVPGGRAGKQRAPAGALEVSTSIHSAYALATIDDGTEQKSRREVLFQPASPRYVDRNTLWAMRKD